MCQFTISKRVKASGGLWRSIHFWDPWQTLKMNQPIVFKFWLRKWWEKLQLHPLQKEKCAHAIFLRWKEFRMEDMFFPKKKTPNFLVPSRHTKNSTVTKNATSLTCSDRSVVADDVGRNSLAGWTYEFPLWKWMSCPLKIYRDHEIAHLGGTQTMQMYDGFDGFSLDSALFGLVI